MKLAKKKGFTLIELMVTISVAAILLAIAAPSFKEFMAAQRIRILSSSLHADLLRGRSEAINRNINVFLLPTANENWSNGWRICTTNNCSTLIGIENQLNNKISIDGYGKTEIKFLPSGRVQEAVKFQLSSSDYSGEAWCVNISMSGQPTLVHHAC